MPAVRSDSLGRSPPRLPAPNDETQRAASGSSRRAQEAAGEEDLFIPEARPNQAGTEDMDDGGQSQNQANSEERIPKHVLEYEAQAQEQGRDRRKWKLLERRK